MTSSQPEPGLPVDLPAPWLTRVEARPAPACVDAALLAVLLDAAPVGFAHYDRGGRFLHVNPALAAVHGAAVEAHLGRTLHDVAPVLATPVGELVAQVLRTGAPVLEVELAALAGWRTSWYPVPDPATGACASVAVVATETGAAASPDDALRRTAMTLQRSLLPHRLPATEELEVAVRYVAGTQDTDVGGDWYDVIALGAGRMALVVGDVMGRGVPAAAVMGQLRTSARTCARLDLRPGEVLDVLDGVLRELGEEAIATCLYAVFDPHTRELRIASAGHVPPLLRTGDGEATALHVDVGAPLGLGDSARETVVSLHPGSVVALYTDGLVELRGSDLEHGIAAVCHVLTEGPADLEALADEVMERRAEDGADDDIALLLVRVPQDVAARSRTVLLEVPRERALMVDVRSQARVAMRSWMLLDEVVDTATLVASELATNALVHGRGRVELRLRLTRDRLVIESVDTGQHMPRRRRAGDEDEGGRGLQLVAQLADRWGFRATDEGKVVWAELDLA